MSQDIVMTKQYNKSLKRRAVDAPFHYNRFPHKPHVPGFSPQKRRRVERREGSDRVSRSHVHTRNRSPSPSPKDHSNHVPRQLNRILGIHQKPSPTCLRSSSDNLLKAELQQRIKALQNILALAEQTEEPIPEPPSPVCSLTHRWTVEINSEKDGITEALASASLEVKTDLLPPTLLPTQLTVRETAHKCLWRYLKTDLSVTQVDVEFRGTDAGKSFRSMLWKTRKVCFSCNDPISLFIFYSHGRRLSTR